MLNKALILWYTKHRRDFPWRKSRDTYRVWLSEIILQQTKAQQGQGYFLKMIDRFPTIESLAQASQEEVLEVWQGLGYYRRAINLHHTARHVVTKYKGVFPTTYNELIKLKGIGDYTASAILSICNNKPYAVLDGNVYRVLARYYGIYKPVGGSLAFKEFKQLASKNLDRLNPGQYNQAIMEFGALVCTFRKPQCHLCILRDNCHAFIHQKIDRLPVKRPKKPSKLRYFNYLVITDKENNVRLEKRTQGDIWPQLYEFPLIETRTRVDTVQKLVSQLGEYKRYLSEEWGIEKWNERAVIHRLTHQTLMITFWVISWSSNLEGAYSVRRLAQLPLPIVLTNFVKKYFVS
ncbi:MAG: A/G-specific adenine glycosylase [Flavobacteriaceae bacterium]|nr:A/G-specific adenine glycosylase [Flavobacteriaceae bacterium]